MGKQTRATAAVAAAKKSFEVLDYAYDPEAPSIGLHAAARLGLPAGQVYKTLMATLGDGTVCVCLVPSDRELNLKALAAAAKRKTAAMLPPAEAERLSRYHIGGISPFGQKKRLPTFVEAAALALPFMVVNGGQRGLQIRMAPADLVAALGATVAEIATKD